MFMVVNDYDRLHANFEVERNFLYCFKRLKDVICNGGKIRDIFFRKLDMLRIKNPVITYALMMTPKARRLSLSMNQSMR